MMKSTKKAESQSLETQSQRKLLPYQLPTGHSIRCPTFKGSYRKKLIHEANNNEN